MFDVGMCGTAHATAAAASHGRVFRTKGWVVAGFFGHAKETCLFRSQSPPAPFHGASEEKGLREFLYMRRLTALDYFSCVAWFDDSVQSIPVANNGFLE